MNTEKQRNETLKEQAVSFLQLVSTGNVDEAYQKHIGEDFRHHNPYFPGDADSLKRAMKENAAEAPEKIFDVKRAMEDGEMVTVHSHVKQSPRDPGAAVVHIFRFHENQIVELWDLGIPVPEESRNENGLF
ncbi:nuclear transport factor 2 family protein [Virgibacillus doumboii]|uniref:nuclear transport factor 2 family protein n=1 Tax=Virgibacillus doumboii TaxID=2697503 RepID=UPI0013DEEA0E|nr:nuclear transport factor 2 family protein [Virgibacillus doumboii]